MACRSKLTTLAVIISIGLLFGVALAQTVPSTAQTNNAEAGRRYLQRSRRDPRWDWKQPINFWGKAVDESNNPVSGATIHFEWTDLSSNGTSEADLISDANGLFALTEKTGKRLVVHVKSAGYYNAKGSVGSFEYANPSEHNFHTPDPKKPVIFRLHKQGTGADLITSTFGMSDDFPVRGIPLDGTPIKVDLLHRKVAKDGQLQLSEIKPPHGHWHDATNWSFKIEIPGGGLVGQNDEFPFEAPQSGYVPEIHFEFSKNAHWTTTLKTNFYIKFGNPVVYGRLKVETGISYGGAFLTYAINPTGSRNLEPKNKFERKPFLFQQ